MATKPAPAPAEPDPVEPTPEPTEPQPEETKPARSALDDPSHPLHHLRNA